MYWTCKGCGIVKEFPRKTDDKFGFCFDCRRQAFGFDLYERPTHTEHKDRHALPLEVLWQQIDEDDYGDNARPQGRTGEFASD